MRTAAVTHSAHSLRLQAQAMRDEAERLFAEHRQWGGYLRARSPDTRPEDREALMQLKRRGDALWQQATAKVQAASEGVLSASQVKIPTSIVAEERKRQDGVVQL